MYNLLALIKKLSKLMVLLIPLTGFQQIYCVDSVSNAIAIDSQNRIICAGFSADPVNNTTNNFTIVRYNPDGSLDREFNSLGPQPGILVQPILTFSGVITGVAIDVNDNIIVCGILTGTVDFTIGSSFCVAKFTETGILDPSFNPSGELPGVVITNISNFDDTARGIKLDAAGNIVVAGITNSGGRTAFALVRYLSDGTLDPDFNSDGERPGIVITNLADNTNDGANALDIDINEKIIITGFTRDLTTFMATLRYDNNGELDTSFNQNGAFPGAAVLPIANSVSFAVKIDHNNKIVVGGSAIDQEVNINPNFALVKYNEDGTFDQSFNPNGILPGSIISDFGISSIAGIAIDIDNKIIATGTIVNDVTDRFTEASNQGSFLTVKYNADASLDTSFHSDGLFPGIIINNIFNGFIVNDINAPRNEGRAIILDTNRNVVVTGFASDGLQNNFTTVRYLPIGELDISFTDRVSQAGIVTTKVFGDSGRTFNELVGVDDPLLEQAIQRHQGIGGETIQTIDQMIQQLTAPIIADGLSALVSSDSRPFIYGSAPANKPMVIKINGIVVGQTISDLSGQWSFGSPSLVDGDYSLEAIVGDPLTGVTVSSSTVRLTINTKLPSPPIIESIINNSFTKEQKVVVTVKTIPDSIVNLYLNGQQIIQDKIEASGLKKFIINLKEDGKYVIYATATNSAGLTSSKSNIISTILDSKPESAPLITTPANKSVISSSSLTITGSAKPYLPIDLFLNNNKITSIVANEKGQWSFTVNNLENKKYNLFAEVKDPFTKKILKSNSIEFEKTGKEIDKELKVDKAADEAKKKSEAQVKESKVRQFQEVSFGPAQKLIKGTASPNAKISIFIDSDLIDQINADKNGQWEYIYTDKYPTIKKPRQFKAMVIDKAGKINTLMSIPI